MAVLFFIFEICETAFLWLYFIVAALLAAREAFTFSIALLAKPAVLSFTLVVALAIFAAVFVFDFPSSYHLNHPLNTLPIVLNSRCSPYTLIILKQKEP